MALRSRSASGTADLDEFRRVFLLRLRLGTDGLFAAPEIEVRDVVNAGYSAVGRAALFGDVFAANVLDRVFVQRLRRIAALLRAIVHEPVLADIQVARAGAALPLVRPPIRDRILEEVQAREVALLQFLHLAID